MKRLIIVLTAIFCFHSVASARVGIEAGPFGELYTLRGPYSWKYRPIPVFGASFYLQTGSLFTLNYSYGFGMFDGNKRCIRSSLAAIAGGAFAYIGEGTWPCVFLGLIIPEGFGLYMRSDHKGFHIALNLLPCDYFYEGKIGMHEYWNYSFGTTLRYRQAFAGGEYAVVPYVEFAVTNPISFSLGCQLMFESHHCSDSDGERNGKRMELPSEKPLPVKQEQRPPLKAAVPERV